MIAKYLWETGSVIITILATIHLYYTFFTNKFSSRNEKVVEEMKISFPILTKKTTLWKAWTGFNASHSSGAMFIGIINFYLSYRYFSFLQSDHFFFLFAIITMSFYGWLGKKYWFNIPFTGIILSLACFMISYILTVINHG
jgi:beta-galactosidase GanA